MATSDSERPEHLQTKATPRRGRASQWRCPACLRAFRRDHIFRQCGFHPRLKTFVGRNRGCATLSMLRWILRQHGVQLLHDELESTPTMYHMTLGDGSVLQAVWTRGQPRVTLMQKIVGGYPQAMDIVSADELLQEYDVEHDPDAEQLSGGWLQ